MVQDRRGYSTKGDQQKILTTKPTILGIAAIAATAVFIGQFMSVVLAPMEAFAPSGRRGFFCEFRPEAQLDIAYPAQMQIMQQTVALQQAGQQDNPMMLIHN